MQHKRLSSSAAAAIIGGNDDLLTEILVLLPAKSLFRFRAVSKHLRSLIDDESFRHRHRVNRRRRLLHHQFILRTTSKPHKSFICDLSAKTLLPLRLEYQSGAAKVLMPFESEYRCVNVLQSSHGLLLLECRRTPHALRHIYVYSRITAQRRFLLCVQGYRLLRLCLIYDPSKSHHYTVFHFEDKYYKFTDINVYDSRTHRWESKVKSNHILDKYPQGVLCNDRLYFIKFFRSPSPSICFSPDNLRFSAVASPPRRRSSPRKKKYVVESNGRLHYLVLHLNKSRNVLLDVYEMIDDKCWVISNRVDSDRPLSASFGVEQIEVLGFVRGDREEEDSILVYHVSGKIMIYHFCHEVSEEIVDFSNESLCQEGSLQFEFKDSHHFIDGFASV